MKVVLFCGGLGTRLREHSETVPKPMVNIGDRPILWHLMNYYLHFGHSEFVLCLGYRGEQIRQYFLDDSQWMVQDARQSGAGRDVRIRNRANPDWSITFVDTGAHASIGERLAAVRHCVEDDPAFLANYSDGLSDVPLAAYLERFRREDKIASFVCVRPSQSFHTVSLEADGLVRDIRQAGQSDVWINGGFFAFKREIFDHLKSQEDLVAEPFRRLIDLRQLTAYRHAGFWACMDTLKDKQAFDDMDARGETPWKVWRPR